MNYIAHYFFDHVPGQPYYNLGLLLPDMLGSFSRRLRPHPGLPWPVKEMHERPLKEGILQHHRADHLFHNSRFFTEGNGFIKTALTTNGLVKPGVRMFFVTHILLELVLDRHLLNTERDVGIRFYDDLARISCERTEDFLLQTGLPAAGFGDHIRRFTEARYLQSYVKDDGLFYALNRMLKATRQNFFEEDSLEMFSLALADIEKYIEDNFELLYKEMKG